MLPPPSVGLGYPSRDRGSGVLGFRLDFQETCPVQVPAERPRAYLQRGLIVRSFGVLLE